MIRAIYELGKVNNDDSNDEILEIIENPNENGKYNNVLFLSFSMNDKKAVFKNIELEEFSESNLKKYFYKKGNSRGGNFTPTLLYTGEPEKTIRNILLPIKKVDSEIFLSVYNCISENSDEIAEKLKGFIKPKEGYIISLKIDDKYLYEYDAVRSQLQKANSEKYKSKYGKESCSENKQCFVCGETKENILGFVNTYNFYTVDKPGFVSGGFDQSLAWKNYPVCDECSITLEKGKKYIRKKLTERFVGMSYMVIPKVIFKPENDEDIELFNKYLEKTFRIRENKNLNANEENKELLFQEEKFTFRYMADMSNNLVYDILFFSEVKQEFEILVHIEDVLPSRLSKIFEIKEKVEDFEIFKNLPKKKDEFYNLYFNFGLVRNFFPNNKEIGNWDKQFLDVTRNIFLDKKMDKAFFVDSFLRIIIPKMLNDLYVISDIKESLLFLKFLMNMELIHNYYQKGVEEMIERNEKNGKYLDFFENHKEVYVMNEIKAVFLTGVLVGNLLNVQYKRNNSKPFYSRLYGLKLNPEKLKAVFSEAINKLNEYEKAHLHKELITMISLYLSSSKMEKMSNNDINYFFILGMNLYQEFIIKEEE